MRLISNWDQSRYILLTLAFFNFLKNEDPDIGNTNEDRARLHFRDILLIVYKEVVFTSFLHLVVLYEQCRRDQDPSLVLNKEEFQESVNLKTPNEILTLELHQDIIECRKNWIRPSFEFSFIFFGFNLFVKIWNVVLYKLNAFLAGKIDRNIRDYIFFDHNVACWLWFQSFQALLVKPEFFVADFVICYGSSPLWKRYNIRHSRMCVYMYVCSMYVYTNFFFDLLSLFS